MAPKLTFLTNLIELNSIKGSCLISSSVAMSLPGVSASTYKSPVFIGLITVMSVAVVLLLHHCLLVTFCDSRRRRRRRLLLLRQQQHTTHHQQQENDDDDTSVDMATSSSSSQAKLVVVVCPYRKAEEEWDEAMCPVCLSEFADGEPVRVLPDCLHYFHVDCIGTWLRSNTSCPLCRADATPTPSSGELHHHLSSISVSLEEILVRT